MLKRLLICFFVFGTCTSYAFGPAYRYRPYAVHAMRAGEMSLNPIAKHPVVPRRVASARRGTRGQKCCMP